jgi:hypothetical protein
VISIARHGDAIRALQDEAATLGKQVAALSAQYATAYQESVSGTLRLEQLGGIVAELTATLELQTGIIQEQAVQIVTLSEEARQRDERVSQLRGDLARIERQAALDLDEMRTTSATITQSLLAIRERQLASSKG